METMNRQEAAAFLKITPGTLKNWVAQGKYDVPFHKAGGRLIFFKAELEAWIRKSGKKK